MERTRSGPELLVAVSRAHPGTLQDQLSEQLRAAIRRGALRSGAALPSTRALAVDLGVSRGVVVEAYAQLAAEGYLQARARSVSRVAAGAGGSSGAGHGVGAGGGAGGSRGVVGSGCAVEEPGVAGPAGVRYDLRPGVPDLALFPRARPGAVPCDGLCARRATATRRGRRVRPPLAPLPGGLRPAPREPARRPRPRAPRGADGRGARRTAPRHPASRRRRRGGGGGGRRSARRRRRGARAPPARGRVATNPAPGLRGASPRPPTAWRSRRWRRRSRRPDQPDGRWTASRRETLAGRLSPARRSPAS